MERPWERIIPLEERNLYRQHGYGFKSEEEIVLGENVALLIIDVTEGFIETCHRIGVFDNPVFSGCLDNVATLLEKFRASNKPVVHITFDRVNERFLGAATRRSISKENQNARDDKIVPQLEPHADELVLRKSKASAFFGTPLDVYLRSQGIDTLVISGTTTSGCIRATVIDAFSHGYRVFVAEEGVMDRSKTTNLVNLFDMNAKYAVVAPMDRIIEAL
jgi:maleamate amidohydrolase